MNPNVLYELAIADAGARPVVLLIQKGEEPPFDIKDHRYVEYDVANDKALRGGVYAQSVQRHVASLLSADDPPVVPFDNTLSPLGAAGASHRAAGRVELAALRRFFGADAQGDPGVTVTVPVYHPLATDNFDQTAEVTMGRKVDESGQVLQRPIYGDILHFDDYNSAQEIFTLLRELRRAWRRASTRLRVSGQLGREAVRRLPGIALRERGARRARPIVGRYRQRLDIGRAFLTDARYVPRHHPPATGARARRRSDPRCSA